MTDLASVRDAKNAEESLQRLVDTTLSLESPQPLEPLLRSLSVSLGCLRRVLEQLGNWHIDHADEIAQPPFPIGPGAGNPVQAASELEQAAWLIDKAGEELESAHTRHSAMTRHPITEALMDRTTGATPPSSFGTHTASEARRDGLSP